LRVRDRSADTCNRRTVRPIGPSHGGPDRRLSGTIEVPKRPNLRRQTSRKLTGQSLPAAQYSQLSPTLPTVTEQHAPEGGGRLHDRDRVLINQLAQRPGIDYALASCEHEPRSTEER